jgi:hypothetical protein
VTTTTVPTIESLLRQEVGELRRRESRRRFDTDVHVGRIGGERRVRTVSRDDLAVLDAGTRTEVVTWLLEELSDLGTGAHVWTTRAGEPTVQDDDLAWLSASLRALGALGLVLDGFWTVTRTGWLDVRSGESRTWKRLRL